MAILSGSCRWLPGFVVTGLRYREEFGISYIGVLEDHMRAFTEVIPLLR